MHVQHLVTDLGNLAIAAPVALAAGAWAWRARGLAVALAFGACFLGAVTAAAALKLPFHVLGTHPEDLGLMQLSSGAPSGHMAVATAVYGCAALMFARTRDRLWRALGMAGCLAAIAGVGITRVTLHTHTLADVAAGLVVAGLFVALFDRVLKRRAQAWMPASGLPLLLAMAATAAVMLASGLSVTSGSVL